MIESSPQIEPLLEEQSISHTRIAHEVVPVRDSLLAILASRVSFSRYRSSPRYARVRVISGNVQNSAVPLLVDTLVVFLADTLPAFAVARLGPGGIARLARITESLVKWAGRVLQFLYLPLRWSIRRWRTIRSVRAARQHRKHVESIFMSPAPGSRNLGVMLDSRVMLEGFSAESTCAQLWLRCVKPVKENCQVFVHLYPEHRDLLPLERRIHGYLCKDHYPVIEVKHWRSDRYFRDEIVLSDIPPGYYRIEAGLIDVATFRKFPVDGSTKTSIDLGWVRIGSGVSP